jgi:hypothetical protein
MRVLSVIEAVIATQTIMSITRKGSAVGKNDDDDKEKQEPKTRIQIS